MLMRVSASVVVSKSALQMFGLLVRLLWAQDQHKTVRCETAFDIP